MRDFEYTTGLKIDGCNKLFNEAAAGWHQSVIAPHESNRLAGDPICPTTCPSTFFATSHPPSLLRSQAEAGVCRGLHVAVQATCRAVIE